MGSLGTAPAHTGGRLDAFHTARPAFILDSLCMELLMYSLLAVAVAVASHINGSQLRPALEVSFVVCRLGSIRAALCSHPPRHE